jgi:hypothetical protein
MKDIQKTRIVARKGNERKKLWWLLRRGDDLYGNAYGIGSHYSRHRSGEFHLRDETPSPGSGPPVMILTSLWWRPRISEALTTGLRELCAHAIFLTSPEDWAHYLDFRPKKEHSRIIEIDCAEVNELGLKAHLTDPHNVGSLRLVEDQENADWRRLCSETVETSTGWLILVEAYDMSKRLQYADEDLPPATTAEAYGMWTRGKIRFGQYQRIREKYGPTSFDGETAS